MRAADEGHVEQLFQQAADLPSGERAGFLDQHCRDDAVRRRVEHLLQHLHAEIKFLERPMFSYPALDQHGLRRLPQKFGHYRILRLLGEGGMGQVFEAQQDHPNRTVALKLIRPGFTSKALMARFEHEAETLGQLQHTGIAHIYEAGCIDTELGPQPFFAMEFINGLPVVDFAQKHSLGTRQRMELLAKLCEAIHYAHLKGIIHRDLKPGNILVTADGQPKILDFGVSRTTGAGLQTVSLHTDVGQLIGTVPYMSPEQVGGESNQIDVRSDVYALGVILYELLSGRLPHDVRQKSLAEAARIIREDDPTRLSSINPVFRGDVETIVSKAIEKDKSRRYQSAVELAADIRRYLIDEPIVARRASAAYQFRKFAKRNKALVGGAAMAFIALVAGIIGVSIFAAREADQRRLADLRAAESQRQAYRSSLSAAAAAIQNADAALARRSLQQAPEPLRGWEWSYLNALADRSVRTLLCGEWTPRSFAISTDDRLLAVGGSDGFVRIWNPQDGSILREVITDNQSVDGLAFSPDSSLLLVGGGSSVGMWSVADGEQLWRLPIQTPPARRAFSPDGALIALAPRGQWQVHLLEARTGRLVRTIDVPDPYVNWVEFSADGSLLVAYIERAIATAVLDSRTGQMIRQLTGDWYACGDGAAVVGVSQTDLVVVDPLTNQEFGRCRRVQGTGFTLNPNLEQVAATEGGSLILRDFHDDRERLRLPAHEQPCQVMFANRAPWIITASDDRTVRIWDARTNASPWVVPASNDGIAAAAVSPDGDRVATVGWGGVKMWDAQSGAELWTTIVSRRGLLSVAFSADSRFVATCDEDDAIIVLDGSSGRTALRFDAPSIVRSVAWVGQSQWIAAGGDGDILLVDAGGDSSTLSTRVLAGRVQRGCCLRSNHDGTLLASSAAAADSTSGTDGFDLQLWDVERGEVRDVLRGHRAEILAIGFEPRGTVLASGSSDGEIILWDVLTAKPLAVLRDHGPDVSALAFSNGGDCLAVACDDLTIRLWRLADRFESFTLSASATTVHELRFTPDDRALLASGADAAILAYELAVPEPALERRDVVRQARQRIDAIVRDFSVADDLAESIASDASISDPIRSAALKMVKARGDNVNYINSRVWWIVRLPGRERAEYQRALRAIEVACTAWPGDHALLNTLATAQFRSGDYQSALSTIDRCAELGQSRWGGPHPSDLLIRAMAQHALGERDAALATLAQAQESLQKPEFSSDGDLAALLFEAQRLLGVAP